MDEERVARLEEQVARLSAIVERLEGRAEQKRRRAHLVLEAGCAIDPSVSFYASTPDHEIRVGADTKVLRGAEWIGPITVGRGCYFNRDSYLRSHVTIGDNVLVGPFVRFITDLHQIGPASKRGGATYREPIIVGDGAWIGASVTIVAPARIGAGVIIAAGAVVTGVVEPDTVVGGVPARLIRPLEG